MKKVLLSLLLTFFVSSSNTCICAENMSENAFLINIDTIPKGSPKSSNGLSNGAITAIALGSVAGGLGAIGGLAYFFLHNGLPLIQGCVMGGASPLSLVCLNDEALLAKLKLSYEKYQLLIKAIENTAIKTCETSKYLVIQDTAIENKTFNTAIFELPDFEKNTLVNVKLTQLSNPFSINNKTPSLDTKLIQSNNTKTAVEYPMYTSKIDGQNGILIKQGQIKLTDKKIAVMTTSFNNLSKKTPAQRYALLVEFQK